MRHASDWDFAAIAELARALRSRKLFKAELLEQTIAHCIAVRARRCCAGARRATAAAQHSRDAEAAVKRS